VAEANIDQQAAARRSGVQTIKRVLPYLWPADNREIRVRVVLALVALVLARVVSVLTPLLYKGAVDSMAPQGAASDGAMLLMFGAVGLTIAYGIARLMSVGFNQLRDVFFAKVGQRALRRLALETFSHMHSLSLRYHITRKTGGLSRIIERGVKGVDFLLRFMLFSIGPLVLELLMIAAIMFFMFDVWYLAVIVVTIAIYIWFTFRVTEWRVQVRKKMNEKDTDANQKAIDSLLNYETVKYFNAEDREAARYDESMRGYQKAALTTSYSLAFLNFGQSFLITTGLVIVMVMAAIGVNNGDLTVGDFVLVNAYMIQITMPLNFLGTVYREIRQSLIDMDEMFSLLRTGREVEDKPGAAALQVSGGALSFKSLNFGYDPERPILRDLNLEVGAGETVAVVGPSGSGKSTIGRLMFRFYDVQSGALSIDGQDVRDVTQKSLHQNIGIVPQDTVLFNDTIGYNIGYGRPDASEEEIVEAAKAAKIHDFIDSLTSGYDTAVGERGLKLSGGEKQRVGIARTLLKNPPILLLDEATSALDTDTERDIQESLRQMSKGRTVITIAHRLSTVVDADKIVVLDNGTIIEQGTHDQLIAKEGRYAQMWQRQASEEDEI
jgi:ATP-binding cassette subfamily B protein